MRFSDVISVIAKPETLAIIRSNVHPNSLNAYCELSLLSATSSRERDIRLLPGLRPSSAADRHQVAEPSGSLARRVWTGYWNHFGRHGQVRHIDFRLGSVGQPDRGRGGWNSSEQSDGQKCCGTSCRGVGPDSLAGVVLFVEQLFWVRVSGWRWCEDWGMSDAMNPDQPPRPSSSESGQWKILAIVAPPAFLTMLCMAAGDPLIGLTPLLVVVGVPSAGIVAGRMLASRRSWPETPRLVSALMHCGLMSFLSFMLCFAGCAASSVFVDR